MSKIIKHLSYNIEFVLERSDKDLNGWLIDHNGKELSGKKVRSFFEKCLAEGKRVYPMGDCDNFDYQKGCLGHSCD